MYTKEDILKQLETFACARGHVVTMHTSLKAIGEVDGGAETLLAALVEYFTPGGGLFCVPTHTWNGNVYDMNKAESCIGTFPVIAAGHPDGVRSVHPTHSMAVFGNKVQAEDYVKDDAFTDTPTSPSGCYGKLYTQDGYILLTGVEHNKNTYLHCVEEMLGISRRFMKDRIEHTVIHKVGEAETRYMYLFGADIRTISSHFPKFEPAFRAHGTIVDGRIGNARVQLCSARKMKEVVEMIYKNAGGAELLVDDVPIDEKLYM